MGIFTPSREGTGQENSKCETSAWPGPMAGSAGGGCSKIALAVSDSLASRLQRGRKHPRARETLGREHSKLGVHPLRLKNGCDTGRARQGQHFNRA